MSILIYNKIIKRMGRLSYQYRAYALLLCSLIILTSLYRSAILYIVVRYIAVLSKQYHTLQPSQIAFGKIYNNK